ncbi:hypothetical protein APHAL10511_001655 [Amanita phalloides]|nr:hypothetical protein APHAL10511_001655 [Amanita phalloides]
MSTPATSSTSSRTLEKPASRKPRSQAHALRKSRIARRRGRGKGGVESDDEFVREVGTDSETDDDLSSTDSVSDSDTEPVSEGAVVGRSRPLTPSTSDSPHSHSKELPARIDDNAQPFFSQPTAWGDIVMDESANGSDLLPVIDFADFHGDAIPTGPVSRPLSRKSKRRSDGSRDRSPQSEPCEDGKGDIDQRRPRSRRSLSSTSKKLSGHSVRQAYQQRLENDPSFVPTVGGFWGHDERLLDKDLRSLSGWWRGRWQNRGRGRGFALRGRGGHGQNLPPNDPDVNGTSTDLPPIERTWTHDGYEEMKRKEEQRHADQQQQSNQTRGVRGGRGGFAAGRGGRGGSTRGGLLSSPARSNITLSQGRVWYAMKPELMWTKQHEAFLFFDSSTKPRKGQGTLYKVKLPGLEVRVVQGVSWARHVNARLRWLKSNVKTQDVALNAYVVRIPKDTQTEKVMEPLTTVEEASLEEIFTVRPNLVTPIPIPIPHSASGRSTAVAIQDTVSVDESVSDEHQPQDTNGTSTDDVATNAISEEQSVKQQPSTGDQRPTLPPLQTVFTPPPVAQPSPAYGAAYPYGPALPPGLALNAHGMPYEVATGRPVYLAPPPMYTPRPMMPSHLAPGAIPFVPSHMHHPSMSPDFVSQASSHTPVNGFSTGMPLFSLPRQRRIEIRAPSEELDGKGSRKGQLRPLATSTRTAIISSPPQPLESSSQTYYPSLTRPSEASTSSGPETREGQVANGDVNNQPPDPHMFSYPSYQPYFYPESYGYYPYMDMSQVGQYDMYSSDPRGAQGSVFY